MKTSVQVAASSRFDSWRQGDFTLSPPPPIREAFVGRNDAHRDPSDDDGPILGAAAITHSCDLVRPPAERPWVLFSPLLALDEPEYALAAKGFFPRYAAVPALAGRRLVANLDRAITVRKTDLSGVELERGCRNDHETRAFAGALERKFARTAFPTDFVEWIRPLVERIRKKYKKETREGNTLRSLSQIRIQASPDWQSADLSVFLWFIHEPVPEHPKDMSDAVDDWLKLLKPDGRFRRIDGTLATLEDMTGADYAFSDLLDLEHLSTAVAARPPTPSP